MTDSELLLKTAEDAAIAAGNVILDVYKRTFKIDYKTDQSPLTEADTLAHEVIVSHLKDTGIPLLSEEGSHLPYAERKLWEYCWLIDPLDGTKEFISRNGEFTVNIALIHFGNPVLGVLHVPISGLIYSAAKGRGAWCRQFPASEKHRIFPSDIQPERLRVVASRSHLNEETSEFISILEKKCGQCDFLSRGSALKICMIAEGSADIYPRFAPTMEWDTAAGHAIALEAGCMVMNDQGEKLIYNKENLRNPGFVIASPKYSELCAGIISGNQ